MRTADDVADLPGRSVSEKLSTLHGIRQALRDGSADPIVIAVRHTIEVCSLDAQLLERLLEAFEFDAKGEVSFETLDDLRWYTARSAEPVGQLILQLFSYRDPDRLRLSNEITSGLQLLNFLQDAREDLANGRCYFPKEDLESFGIGSAQRIGESPNTAKLLEFEGERVRAMLKAGAALPEMVGGRLRFELRAILLGAFALLRKLESRGWSGVLVKGARPTLSRREHLRILFRALIGPV